MSEGENGTKGKKAFKVLLQDIAVLGLPFSTTDVELKEYFEESCGELSYYEVFLIHVLVYYGSCVIACKIGTRF